MYADAHDPSQRNTKSAARESVNYFFFYNLIWLWYFQWHPYFSSVPYPHAEVLLTAVSI